MTPLEALQQKVSEASEAGVFKKLARNCIITVLAFSALATFLVVMLLVTNALYWAIGGWGVVIGLILTGGILIGACVTAVELT